MAKKNMAFSHMAKEKSGYFATWLKSCLAKKNMAFCQMANNQKSIYQESRHR